jgi:transposase
MIGVDEISYRKGQRYLTQVCDHRSGAIVWAKPGRNAQTLQGFFDELGDHKASIRAVSIDMNGGYEKAIRHGLPGAQICFDPFHLVQLAARAVDDVRRAEWNAQGKSKTGHGRWVKGLRWSLLKAPEKQTVRQLAALHEVSTANRRLYRAFLLKEELRLLYHLDDPSLAEPTWPPGWPGPHAASWGHSSSSPAPSAHDARASSPRSTSALTTAAWKASTARSGSSRTAASASTAPNP